MSKHTLQVTVRAVVAVRCAVNTVQPDLRACTTTASTTNDDSKKQRRGLGCGGLPWFAMACLAICFVLLLFPLLSRLLSMGCVLAPLRFYGILVLASRGYSIMFSAFLHFCLSPVCFLVLFSLCLLCFSSTAITSLLGRILASTKMNQLILQALLYRPVVTMEQLA